MRSLRQFVSAMVLVLGLGVAWSVNATAGEEASAAAAKAFLDECAKKAAGADSMTVPGKDGWLFYKAELRHLGAGEFWGSAADKVSVSEQPDSKDPLAAILNYKEQLDKLGIELILMPVPPKAVVYPEMISGTVTAKDGQPASRLDANHQAFYRLLAEKGVKVIDLVPEFLTHRTDEKGPLYCKTDTHWSGQACVLAAQAVARELRDKPWLKDAAKAKFGSEERTVSIRGDLVAALKTKPEPDAEKLVLRFVGNKGGSALEPVKPDMASPVLLISDSHGLVFHVGEDLFARGAGLPDQLALELGLAVDTISSRGDGATKVRIDLYQRAKSKPDWLAGKKVVIWCFSAREFTECTNGWRKLPVKK